MHLRICERRHLFGITIDMRKFLLSWIINTIALLVVTRIVAGIQVENFAVALIAALVLGLLNIFLKPIIIFITLPLNILSLGIFTFFINGFVLFLASKIVQGFIVAGFWSAFWGALIFSIVNILLNWFLNPKIHVSGGIRRPPPPPPSRRRVIDAEIVDEDKK